MKVIDETYKGDGITKELLDGIKEGDSIKVNTWGKWHKVKGVIDDYFVVTCKMFGKVWYSVCEKKRWDGIKHNQMIGGKFHVGTDHWIFTAPSWLEFTDGKMDFDNHEATIAYLNSFELPEHDRCQSRISPRNSVPIEKIQIRRNMNEDIG